MDFRPKFINGTDMEFKDISSEESRQYAFPEGAEVLILTIDQPYMLHVSESGGHRIFDMDGICHYIPPGWIHLSWKTKPGQPHFIA